MAGRRPMQPLVVKTMSEKFREEEREKTVAKDKRTLAEERMAAMAAKLGAAQQTVTERKQRDSRRLLEEESEERRKFIDVDDHETSVDEYRTAKRAKIENVEREKNEFNFMEMVRKREHWESKKTRDCGEWRRDNCERGDGCKFRHAPSAHPRFQEFIKKNGSPPASILHFMNYIS